MNITDNKLIKGNAMNPQDDDIIAQIATLDVGKPLPQGWTVMTGNSGWSIIGRVAMRMQIEAGV